LINKSVEKALANAANFAFRQFKLSRDLRTIVVK